MAIAKYPTVPKGATGVLVLGDGTVIFGRGFGAQGEAVGELCFHTAMTGYQEIMTDPSFAGQIITFTFPHIGNVGTNLDDVEAETPWALGCVVREDVTTPSSFRNVEPFDVWLKERGRIGLSGVDTRALTRRVRMNGAPNAVIAYDPDGKFDLKALHQKAAAWPGLEGMDLAIEVTQAGREWEGGPWHLGSGYEFESPSSLREGPGVGQSGEAPSPPPTPPASRRGEDRPHVVAIDYGAKHNIFRNLVKAGARVTVLPATATYDEIVALRPAGVFLSNGPGDPAATGDYAVPVIKRLIDENMPIFGICLGHQMLGIAAGAKTSKMHQGHRGANHPVKRLDTGAVEITSMNHGFAVDSATLPANVVETHVSLFDGSNCGIAFTDRPVFGVQYHPEASPGPQDSFYLFEKFVGGITLMGLVAVAIALAAQASPPPGIVQNEQQPGGQFAGLPCFDYAGAKHCVRSIVVSGKKKDMNAARAKLAAEGWPSVYRADRSGEPILDIDAKNRTLDEAWALTNRFASKEFGPLQADFSSLPVPGSK